MSAYRVVILFVLAFLPFAPAIRAQSATGQYPSGSFDSFGVDTINVGSLNLMLTIPIIHRKGRGGDDFDYDLQYNGAFWSKDATGTWSAPSNWGWANPTGTFSGHLNYDQRNVTCTTVGYGTAPAVKITNFSYTDNAGVEHDWTGYLTNSSGGCANDIDALSGTSSTDGQYTVGPQSEGFPLTDIFGNVTYAPDGVISSKGASLADSNGNLITADTNGNITDTSGNVVLNYSKDSQTSRTYTFLSRDGTTKQIHALYTHYNIATNFGCAKISEFSGSDYLVSSIVLPDGSSYQFGYEATPGIPGSVTGRLATLQLPTGGTIQYTYLGANNGIGCAEGTPLSLQRQMISASGQPTRVYTRTPASGTQPLQVAVTDENGNAYSYNFTKWNPGIGEPQFFPTLVTVRPAQGGTPLVKRVLCYNGMSYPCTDATLAAAIKKVDEWDTYDGVVTSGSTATFNFNKQPTSIVTYDFGANSSRGAALRTETLTYTTNNGGLVTDDELADANGTFQKTTMQYDQNPASDVGAAPNWTQNPGSGNLTEVDHWVSPATSSAVLADHMTYDNTGSMLTSHPAGLGTTQYSYGAADMYLAAITRPDPNGVGMITQITPDAWGGVSESIDPNGIDREVLSYDADGNVTESRVRAGTTQIAEQTASYLPNHISAQRYQNGSAASQTDAYLDSYGRRTRTVAQAYNNLWYVTDRCLDNMGNTSWAYSPVASSSANPAQPSCNNGGYVYDALGRMTNYTDANGAVTQYQYKGNAVKVTDPNHVVSIKQHDGLGRVSTVCEITQTALAGESPSGCGTTISGTGFLTSYSYSGSTSHVTQGSRSRTFTYDGIGRLTAKVEPEMSGGSAQTAYSYSSNATGIVVTRTRPASGQSNPAVVTNTVTQFDLAGRPVSITYDDGITPTKTFTYDAAPAGSNFNAGLAKGKLVEAANSAGAATMYSYGVDAVGQTQTITQCPPGWCNSTYPGFTRNYEYDWIGNPTSEQYSTSSAPVTLTYGSNLANQLTQVTSTADSSLTAPLYSVTRMSPFGATAVNYANGNSASLSYDNAGHPQGYAVGSATTDFYTYSVAWTGNRVTTSNDGLYSGVLNGSGSYTYDDFGRLSTASLNTANGSLGLEWGYDRYGNRLSQTKTSGTYNGYLNQFSYAVNTANQIATGGYVYDAAGNLLSNGVNNYSYDADHNLIAAYSGSTPLYTYTYDALNQRVGQSSGSGGPSYFYGFSSHGQRVTTWDASSGNLVSANQAGIGYVLSDGRMRFQHLDWIGTERVRFNNDGTLDNAFASLPFGDGYTGVAGNPDTDPYHFAGLDQNVGYLNHATFREYNTQTGNWLTTDPFDGSYNTNDPQSLNRYSYVGNDPLSFSDPLGLHRHHRLKFLNPLPSWLGGETDEEKNEDAAIAISLYITVQLNEPPIPPAPTPPSDADMDAMGLDLLGLGAAIAGENVTGAAKTAAQFTGATIAGKSIADNPSKTNTAVNVLGLFPYVGLPVAAAQVVNDLRTTGVQAFEYGVSEIEETVYDNTAPSATPTDDVAIPGVP